MEEIWELAFLLLQINLNEYSLPYLLMVIKAISYSGLIGFKDIVFLCEGRKLRSLVNSS